MTKAPERGSSAYMLFFNENRQKILTENPGIAFTDVAKKAAEMWKAQTDKTVIKPFTNTFGRLLTY